MASERIYTLNDIMGGMTSIIPYYLIKVGEFNAFLPISLSKEVLKGLPFGELRIHGLQDTKVTSP